MFQNLFRPEMSPAISNAFTHMNKNSKLEIENLSLEAHENGLQIGFNVEETLKRVKTQGASYGLIGILDRVKQLQGEIQIKSTDKEGTTYSVKLPMNREVLKD